MNATVYDLLYLRVGNHVKYYRDDLIKHDRREIEARPGVPFINIARECGTHMVFHTPPDDPEYPPEGKNVPYLFGHADREWILRGKRTMIEWHKRESIDPLHKILITYYNGKTMVPIGIDRALTLAFEYERRILNAWKQAKEDPTARRTCIANDRGWQIA